MMTNQELNAVVMPNSALQLEWNSTEEPVSKSSVLLQEEIYNRFTSDPNDCLLFLGFCDKAVRLSPSLDFWRNFAGTFARKLSRIPNSELFRHEVKIPDDADEIRQQLEATPLMTGSEYLNTELLKKTWSGIRRKFFQTLRSYHGTVEDFIRTYSPDVHLVGRVFFHLVENKNNDLPFAFLATYSTRLDKQGKSRHLPLKHALEEYGEDE